MSKWGYDIMKYINILVLTETCLDSDMDNIVMNERIE